MTTSPLASMDSVDLLASVHPGHILLGALVVLGVFLGVREWRYRRRIRRAVVGLRSTNPLTRAGSVDVAVVVGLDATASHIVDMISVETEPGVLDVVARAVAGHAWEPSSSRSLAELRVWARAYLEAHPALRLEGLESSKEPSDSLRPHVAFGSLPPDIRIPSVPPVVGEAHLLDRVAVANPHAAQRVSVPGVPQQFATEETSLTTHDGTPRTVILVTGAGGPAGVAVIRALNAAGHRTIGFDADPMAVGLKLASVGVVGPRWNDPTYGPELLRIAAAHGVQALIATVVEEYAALDAIRDRLDALGVATLLPDGTTAARCADKWLFFGALSAAGVTTPATGLGTANGIVGPWVVKPRSGRGSRDVHLIDRADHLPYAIAVTPNPLVQHRCAGREFTADCLVDATGAVLAVVPRWRLETKAGISTKGRTFDDAEVRSACERTLKSVDHIGPANVQGFVADDGTVCIIEVNPRFSGGLPLSLHAGADLVGEYVRLLLHLPVRPERLVHRNGVTMLRHFEEVYVG